MQKLHKTDLILCFIIIPLAILIRLPGLFYPLAFSGDALGYLAKAMKFGTGDLNPHYFTHPALSFYITFFAEAVFFVFSYLLGFVHSISKFADLFFVNLTPFLVAGRIPSLFFGIGTIYLVYLIGKKIWNSEAALCASLMLAVTPLCILESQTIRIRSIATFFGMLCLFFVFNILKKGRKRDYVTAGISLGLALATEYTMVFVALPLFTAIVIRYRNQKFDKNGISISVKKGLLLACIFALGAFVTFSPYTFFDYPANLKNIMLNLNFGLEPTLTLYPDTTLDAARRLNPDTININYARVITMLKGYITRSYCQISNLFIVEFTMGKVFATLSMAGVLFAIYKRDKKDIILLTLLAGYFVVQPFLVFARPRMIVMTYPVLLLLASRFLITSLEKIFYEKKMQKLVFYLIVFVLALPNIAWSIKHNHQLFQKDTRLMAKEWIEENIPSGSHILLTGSGSNRGVVPLNENKASLYGKYLRYQSVIDTNPNYRGNAMLQVKTKMKIIQEPSYYIDYFYRPELLAFENKFREDYSIGIVNPEVLPIDRCKRIGIDYVIVSRGKPSDNYHSEEDRVNYPASYDFFRSLENECRLVKVFQYPNSLVKLRKPSINPEIKIYSLH